MKKSKHKSLGMGLDSLLKSSQVEIEKIFQEPEEPSDRIEITTEEVTEAITEETEKTSGSEPSPTVLEENEQGEKVESPPTPEFIPTTEAADESPLSPPAEPTATVEEVVAVEESVPETSTAPDEKGVVQDSAFQDELQQLAEQEKEDFEFLEFSIGGELFGLDVQIIQEIIKMPPLTSIPESPDYIEGIFSLRSHVIPLVNTGRFLSLNDEPLSAEKMVIILKIAETRIALGVDHVHSISRISASEIKSTPSVLSSQNADLLKGIARKGNKSITFLNPVTLLNKLQIARYFVPEGSY